MGSHSPADSRDHKPSSTDGSPDAATPAAAANPRGAVGEASDDLLERLRADASPTAFVPAARPRS